MTDAQLPWPGTWYPLGATPDTEGTNFALWADGATGVEVCLFDAAGDETRYPLTERTFHVWHGYLPDIGPGQHYGFRVHGPWNPPQGDRFNAAKLLLDPYARAIDGSLDNVPAVYGHVGGDGSSGDDTVQDESDSAPHVPKSVVVGSSFDWATTRHRPPRGATRRSTSCTYVASPSSTRTSPRSCAAPTPGSRTRPPSSTSSTSASRPSSCSRCTTSSASRGWSSAA